jgi:chaperonin cofactor prefoldin
MKTKEEIEKLYDDLKVKREVFFLLIEEIERDNEIPAGELKKKLNIINRNVILLEWVLDIELPF